ncbi:MAG: chemotaxis protein [Pseudomonadota bacterium]
MSDKKEILLDSGTNEMEALIFRLKGQEYGVNVAKIHELITPPVTRALPGSSNSVIGVFRLRDENIALVDLAYHLNPEEGRLDGGNTVIITAFNEKKTAFLVDSADHIERVSWDQIVPPADGLVSEGAITGILQLTDRIVPMLDFEAIQGEIVGRQWGEQEAEKVAHCAERENLSVYVVDDSSVVRKSLYMILEDSGVGQITMFNNGEEAWRSVCKAAELKLLPDIMISDIEMPQMDGFTLTRKIKETPAMRNMPVILFSSIVSQDSLHKGYQVGADAQLSKADLSKLIPALDELIGEKDGLNSTAEFKIG